MVIYVILNRFVSIFHYVEMICTHSYLFNFFFHFKVVKEEGWNMIHDPKQLETICKLILSTNPKHVPQHF